MMMMMMMMMMPFICSRFLQLCSGLEHNHDDDVFLLFLQKQKGGCGVILAYVRPDLRACTKLLLAVAAAARCSPLLLLPLLLLPPLLEATTWSPRLQLQLPQLLLATAAAIVLWGCQRPSCC
jgi:hypothetical protein